MRIVVPTVHPRQQSDPPVGHPPYFTVPTAGLYNTVLRMGLQDLKKNSAKISSLTVWCPE